MVLTRSQKQQAIITEERVRKALEEKDKKSREEADCVENQIERLKKKYQSKTKAIVMAPKIDIIFSNVDSFWNEITDSTKLDVLIQSLGTIEGTKFDFNGFDPNKLLEQLINYAKEKKRTRQDFFKDIIDMILIGLCRGNIREDQIDKTVDGGGAARIKELIGIYHIRKRVNASDRSAAEVNDLTFTRMISLMPHLASLLLYSSSYLARPIRSSAFGSDKLPQAMQHSGFAGLIPDGIKFLTNVFSYAHTAYMIDFSILINPSVKTLSLEELYQTQSRFCKISIANSKYSADMRVKFLIKLGLNDSLNFERILTVANSLHNKLKKKDMKLDAIRAACIKNNLIAYRSDDTVLSNLTKQAAAIKNIEIQGVASSSTVQQGIGAADDVDDEPDF